MKIIRNDIIPISELLPGDVFIEQGDETLMVIEYDGKRLAVDLSNGQVWDYNFSQSKDVSLYPNAMIKLV